jgi:isopenicillin N synthase-like dioxygenase
MKKNDIPVINIERLFEPGTLAELDQACRDWGFFQVVNHGVSQTVLDELRDRMQLFFAMPRDTKRTIERTAENPLGYFDQELTKNTPDWKETFDYGPTAPSAQGSGPLLVPQWPRFVPGFKAAVQAYYQACERLAFNLLKAIALNLRTEPEVLLAQFQPRHTSFVRLNYYPVCPKPARPAHLETPRDGYLGVNHHTDAGALTLLHQADEPGLEVFRNAAWHLVALRPEALVINIGDIVQVWSNDEYRAALHRVRANAGKARMSAPFFLNPSYEADYAPLPGMIDASRPARYRAINWGEFRRLRVADDYADQGEEVQISRYAMAPPLARTAQPTAGG